MFWKKPSGRPPFRRRQYVVDREMQMGVAAQLLVGLGVVALMFFAGMFVFLGDDAMAGMSIAAVRHFLLTANAVYFVLAAAVLTVLSLLITHRFAGPAYVMALAVQGMLKGDYGRRLKLRRRDYLKPLAEGLDTLRAQWIQRDEDLRQALDELGRALREGDVEAAERTVARLQALRMIRPETVSAPRHEKARERSKTTATVTS